MFLELIGAMHISTSPWVWVSEDLTWEDHLITSPNNSLCIALVFLFRVFYLVMRIRWHILMKYAINHSNWKLVRSFLEWSRPIKLLSGRIFL